MAAPAAREPVERTYGQWHPGRRAGLFGLGPVATGTGLVVVAIAAGLVPISRLVAVVVAVAGLAGLVPLAIRIGGRTGAQVLASRLAWWWGRSKRQHLYRSGVASRVAGEHRLPGILASSQLFTVEDGRASEIGVVVVPQSRHYTAVVRCGSEGVDLVDTEVIDARVARLAAWLSGLGRERLLVQAQLIVETAPDPGRRLATELATTTRADAPALARDVLDEVVATYPAGAATVDIYAAFTFTPAGRGRTPHADFCREVAARLPHLQQGLAGTGATGLAVLPPADLIKVMRTAYSPTDADDIAATPAAHLAWEHAGPLAARETWDCYRHEAAWSKTWGLSEAPRGTVYATTFSRLTDPIPGLLRKRVSLIYQPYSPEEAARLVEADKRDAAFLASKKARPSARDLVAMAAAEQAAAEEASGAGVERFTILATATVADRADLDEAESAIKARAGQARLLLRPMYACQAATFAANLPVGVVLPTHATIPH